jgi:hypothetical protein
MKTIKWLLFISALLIAFAYIPDKYITLLFGLGLLGVLMLAVFSIK